MILAVFVEAAARGRPLPSVVRALGEHPAVSWIRGRGVPRRRHRDRPAENMYTGTKFQGFVITSCTPLFATFLFLPLVIGGGRSVIRSTLRSAPMAWDGIGVLRRVPVAPTDHGGGQSNTDQRQRRAHGHRWFGFRYAIAISLVLVSRRVSWYLIERPCVALSRRVPTCSRPAPVSTGAGVDVRS